MNELDKMTKLIKELQEHSSSIDKKNILRQYSDLKELLKLVYDPQINFWITGDRVEQDLFTTFIFSNTNSNSILELLNTLSKRIMTGNAALRECLGFIKLNLENKDTIIKILNKDLECGISIKTINSVFPDLIFNFEDHVPLAKKIEDFKGDVFDGSFFISRKLDGIRCLAFLSSNNVKFFSREGKEIFTLNLIKEELYSLCDPWENLILDGELCIYKDSQEYFNEITKVFRRKDYTIQNPMFYIFDAYSKKQWEGKIIGANYSLYYSNIKTVIEGQNFKYIKVLDQIKLQNEKQLQIPFGWEGFILRKDVPTEFKRSNNLLKVKDFKEEEFKILGIKYGDMMIEGRKQNICSSLSIEYKGYLVDVGSGLSQEQRLAWIDNPNLIVGKVATIKYFSESIDKNGNLSLRFPIFKGIREKE